MLSIILIIMTRKFGFYDYICLPPYIKQQVLCIDLVTKRSYEKTKISIQMCYSSGSQLLLTDYPKPPILYLLKIEITLQ